MIGNLRIMVLLLVTIFVMLALAAATASAQGKLTSDGPVTLTATQTGAPSNTSITAFGRGVVCESATYTGHKVGTGELLPSGSTTITVTPQYAPEAFCTDSGGNRTTIEMNGCDYVYHIGGTIIFTSRHAVTADIVCPKDKKIHIGTWSSGAAHTAGNKLCTLEIPPQSGLQGASILTNSLFDDFSLEETLGKLKIERHGLCLLDGQGTTTSEGKFDVSTTFKGVNSAGGATGVTVTD